jgi:LysM repeat protein
MEKNKKNILFLILLLFALSFDVVAAKEKKTKEIPIVKLFDKSYYKYEVKSKESLYSICKKFNVSEAELLTMNPYIVEGLKSGQTLMIPVKITEISTEKEIQIDNEDTSAKLISTENNRKKTIFISTDKPRITVFLPFETTSSPGVNDRYLEFYEGFLLAVDSLKTLGLTFEVQALESGSNAEAISHAIITGKLDETDYCIGGTTPEQISLLTEWAQKNQRNLVIPFSTRVAELENNPYIFQTNPPHSYIYDHFAEYTVSQIDKSKIIFLNSGSKDTDLSSSLVLKIKSGLQKKKVAYIDVTDDELLESLAKVLVDNRENTIIPYSLSMSETNRLVTRLGAFVKANPQKKITLIGYPEWQAMNKTYLKQLYALNTYIFSSFYADTQRKNVRDFQVQFNQTFGRNLINSYPKYGMMGYDLATFFIPRMVFEKNDNIDKIPVVSYLQNEFQFGTKKPVSGAFNKVFYIIHYTPDNTVEVKPQY